MKKKIIEILLFPLPLIRDLGKLFRKQFKISTFFTKDRVIKAYKLNLNQTRYSEGELIVKEILKNKFYRIWIPLRIRIEFYGEPLRIIFSVVKNYLKQLYKWSKLELEVYIFHMQEVKGVKKMLKGIWYLYFVLIFSVILVLLWGINTIYLFPLIWKLLGLCVSGAYLHNLGEVLDWFSIFFYLIIIGNAWNATVWLLSSKKNSEDLTEKIRELDIFDSYDTNWFYKKGISKDVSLFHGGFTLSEYEKEVELRNRESESWKVEWLGLESYRVIDLYLNIGKKKKKKFRLEDLESDSYLQKYLNYGSKYLFQAETLEEAYRMWERGFEKIKTRLRDIPVVEEWETDELELDKGFEKGDVWDSFSRMAIQLSDEDEDEFYLFTMEPELDFGIFIMDTGESDNPGGVFYNRYYDETELLDCLTIEKEEKKGKAGGRLDLYKNLDEMVFRRKDLIKSENVDPMRWKEGILSDPMGPEIPRIEEEFPLELDSVEELSVLLNLENRKKKEPLDLRIVKEASNEYEAEGAKDEERLLEGMRSEYEPEILLIDEIYMSAEKEKSKTLLEMEMSYLETEEIVSWSKVLKGYQNWYDEPYEIFWLMEGIEKPPEFIEFSPWEEEEVWTTGEESTWLVEDPEDDLDNPYPWNIDDLGIIVCVYLYVWFQSFSGTGYLPMYDGMRKKEKDDEKYMLQGYKYLFIKRRFRKRKRMRFTKRYIHDVLQNQTLKEKEDLLHAGEYDEGSFYYLENYDRYDLIAEVDYGHVLGMPNRPLWLENETFGIEFESPRQGFYHFIDFSYTFWGTGFKLLVLLLKGMVGILLTVIDWTTTVLWWIPTWYFYYWWPLFGWLILFIFHYLVESFYVYGTIICSFLDVVKVIWKSFLMGNLSNEHWLMIWDGWKYNIDLDFENFKFYRGTLEYWNSVIFEKYPIRDFVWSKINEIKYPTMWMKMSGKDLTLIGQGFDNLLLVIEKLYLKINLLLKYSWGIFGIMIKICALVLVYGVKVGSYLVFLFLKCVLIFIYYFLYIW